MKKEINMSHTLMVGYLLAFAGGFLDVYTYICRDGVFANAQTGNMVLLGVSVAKGNFLSAINYSIPVFAFVFGVIVSYFIKSKFLENDFLQWKQIVLGVEIVSLIAVAFVPEGKISNMIVNIIISFVCSLQVQSFRRIKGNILATTMCTGNLRSGVEALCRYGENRDKADLKSGLVYLSVILSFIVGAAVGAVITNIFMCISALIPCFVLIIVFVMLFIKKKRKWMS